MLDLELEACCERESEVKGKGREFVNAKMERKASKI
jgi:hypothetical protein